MPPHPHIEDSQGSHSPDLGTSRLGHRIREIRQQLHHRHATATRYQVTITHAPERPRTGPASLTPVTSDEYQARLYARTRSTNPAARLAAAREAISTSPHTWEDLTTDGAREWVEESIEDDNLLAAAIDTLGDLEPPERPYLGKFVAEQVYETLTDAEAAYWRRVVPYRHR